MASGIALARISLLCQRYGKEVFSAIKGKGSFLNGQPIHVSNAEKLSDTMIGLETAKRELADENFARFRRGAVSARMYAGLSLPLWN